MRFALAVAGGAVVQLIPYVRSDTPAVLAIAYVVFAAFGVGFFAGRRAWLAGTLSVLMGAALYGLVSHFMSRPTGPAIGDLLTAETGLILGVLPYAFLGALAGVGGGALRSRALGPTR